MIAEGGGHETNRRRTNTRWTTKQITAVGHRSWGPLGMVQIAHLWVISSRGRAAEVFINQLLSVGVPELLLGSGNSPELQPDLHVNYKCCLEEVGPACTELRAKGCEWDSQSTSRGPLRDAARPRRVLDWMGCVCAFPTPSTPEDLFAAIQVVYNQNLDFYAFYVLF